MHPTKTMPRKFRRKSHPWGVPPWRVRYRPAQRALPDYVDFAIVGAGFTGLSAAAWLRKLAPEKSVLVLESASVGDGASGRTGGLALDETAAGPLHGLGDVLAAYKKVLRALRVDSQSSFPGAYELSRSARVNNSPISWSDSGNLQVVGVVPGGAIDPGKILDGLARAAERAGTQIAEHAHVRAIDFEDPPRLSIRHNLRVRIREKVISAGKILLATNAFSLELSGLRSTPKLTLALATSPLTAAQLKAIGLSSRRPFYTVDLPYLWGRVLDSNGIVFGSGLVPMPSSPSELFHPAANARSRKSASIDLSSIDVRKGEAAGRLRWLESRVRNLHPALHSVRITHRWAGPILFT